MARTKSQKGQPSTRLLRVGESVRHAVSAVLARGDIRDDDLKGASVTVSEVRLSPDLRHAKVFVMTLGGERLDQVLAALNRHAGYIRGQTAKALTTKYTPDLKFSPMRVLMKQAISTSSCATPRWPVIWPVIWPMIWPKIWRRMRMPSPKIRLRTDPF